MRRLSKLIIAALLATGLCGAGADAQEPEWPRILRGHPLEYPRDHGAHPEYRTEWWYVTGNVEDTEGRAFGFQFTIFRSAMAPGSPAAGASPLRAYQVFAGHMAVSDIENERTLFAERMRRASPLASAATHDLALHLEDWSFEREADDVLRISAADPLRDIGLELELRPERPFVLHGEDGVSSKGGAAGNASAYLSWTRLNVSGTLAAGGDPRPVRGRAWFDHEFGSSVLGDGVSGWDWFGLHLADGRDLMLFQLRGEGQAPVITGAGSLVAADGRVTALGPTDLRITPRGTWTSPSTKTVYPSGWSIQLPNHGLDLIATPRVRDAEISAAGSVGVSYWEGPVELSEANGGASAGLGYAELTGYAGSMRARF